MVNQYELDRLLGSGTFGKVFSCIDTNDGKTYAVKVIPRNQFKGVAGGTGTIE